MAVQGRPAAVFKVYDRQKQLVFTGTGREIAYHFQVSRDTVYGCIERHGRLLWEYELVKDEKEEMPK